jgi:hypothetical protein
MSAKPPSRSATVLPHPPKASIQPSVPVGELHKSYQRWTKILLDQSWLLYLSAALHMQDKNHHVFCRRLCGSKTLIEEHVESLEIRHLSRTQPSNICAMIRDQETFHGCCPSTLVPYRCVKGARAFEAFRVNFVLLWRLDTSIIPVSALGTRHTY